MTNVLIRTLVICKRARDQLNTLVHYSHDSDNVGVHRRYKKTVNILDTTVASSDLCTHPNNKSMSAWSMHVITI